MHDEKGCADSPVIVAALFDWTVKTFKRPYSMSFSFSVYFFFALETIVLGAGLLFWKENLPRGRLILIIVDTSILLVALVVGHPPRSR